jgi:hypothetical protein
MSQKEIDDIIAIKQGAIETLLKKVYQKINGYNTSNMYIYFKIVTLIPS